MLNGSDLCAMTVYLTCLHNLAVLLLSTQQINAVIQIAADCDPVL